MTNYKLHNDLSIVFHNIYKIIHDTDRKVNRFFQLYCKYFLNITSKCPQTDSDTASRTPHRARGETRGLPIPRPCRHG